MAGCDSDCKFNIFSCQASGGTHDHLAWGMTAAHEMVAQGDLKYTYYIIGDEAFVNSEHLLTPWSGTGLGVWKDSFNYHLSSMRQCIERAFGLLTQRWGVFWRPLRVQFKFWSLVCTVAAKLHNFCIDERIPNVQEHHDDDRQPGDEWSRSKP